MSFGPFQVIELKRRDLVLAAAGGLVAHLSMLGGPPAARGQEKGNGKEPDAERVKAEFAAVQGTWRCLRREQEGVVVPEEARRKVSVVVKGETYKSADPHPLGDPEPGGRPLHPGRARRYDRSLPAPAVEGRACIGRHRPVPAVRRHLRALTARQSSEALSARVGPDDIVRSLFRTFFRRVNTDPYDVPRGEDLWKLFLVIALNEIRNAAAHHTTASPTSVSSTPPNSRYEVESSLSTATDTDFFRVVAPAGTGHRVLAVNAVAVSGQTAAPQPEVFDAEGVRLPAAVLANDSGLLTVKVDGLTAGATYLVRAFGTQPGSYRLIAPSTRTSWSEPARSTAWM